MRTEDLKYLLEIERCGSLNKAAQNLFLSHSSLSHMFQNIEHELGYQIFSRSKRGVVPTPRGEVVLSECRIILDLIDRWHDPSTASTQMKGHVQISSIPIFARILGLDMLLKLRTGYPGLTIHFEEHRMFTWEDLCAQLSRTSSRILVGTLSDPELAVFQHKFSAHKDWAFHIARGDALCLHISVQNPLSQRQVLYPEELAGLPLLFYPDSGGQFNYRNVLRYFTSVQPYKVSTADLVLDMVRENLSVSLSSRWATALSPAIQNREIRWVPISGFDMPMNYYVLYPAQASISAAEQIVVEELRTCFDSMKETLLSVPQS